MKELFISRNFSADSMFIIRQADAICRDYATQGYGVSGSVTILSLSLGILYSNR